LAQTVGPREKEVEVPKLSIEDTQPQPYGQDNRTGQEPQSQRVLPIGDEGATATKTPSLPVKGARIVAKARIVDLWPSWIIAAGLILSVMWIGILLWLLVRFLTIVL
jgi:hypothetical protein